MTQFLIDGKNAFPVLERLIKEARESIDVNMFIWRNDTIGNRIASLLLEAADRGVSVRISKDRYGIICESCEENRKSFFHRSPTLSEKIRIAFLSLFYNRDPKVKTEPVAEDDGVLLNRLSMHPNVRLECRDKFDHSKFFIFDGSILFFGGINIEDKENGYDFAGRPYHDFALVTDEAGLVEEFLETRKQPAHGGHFEMNFKERDEWFGMEEAYLKLIRDAKQELTILMAYLSPLPAFEKEILAAANRGVKVRLVIPEKANFQDDTNKKSAVRLLKRSCGAIRVYTYPGMLHAKFIASEKTVSFGSCNITKKAFAQLDELNLFWEEKNDPDRVMREAAEETIRQSREVKNLSYRPIRAFAEGFLV